MDKGDRVKIVLWVTLTAGILAICGLLIWFVCWLRYDRSEYDWGENLAVGVYTTDDQAVVDFFGSEVYFEIAAKNSRDCDGQELLNYLPQSRVFRLYNADGERMTTRVISEDLYGPGNFDVEVYKSDGDVLIIHIGFIFRTEGGIIKDTLSFESYYPNRIESQFTRSNRND